MMTGMVWKGCSLEHRVKRTASTFQKDFVWSLMRADSWGRRTTNLEEGMSLMRLAINSLTEESARFENHRDVNLRRQKMSFLPG